MAKRTADSGLHPIQVVVRRAGITADVLRAWEKRYGVVMPARSVTGRRLYSDADIERLRLVREAMAGGRRIGDVAKLSHGVLERLVREDRERVVANTEAGLRSPVDEPDLLDPALAAVRQADQRGLYRLLFRAVLVLTPSRFIEELATPLMHEVGALWERGELSPGHEHAATEAMRRVLSEMFAMLQASSDGRPSLVVATPSGQRHEIGAMLAATTAALEGWRVTYLGADLPAHDIARIARDVRAVAVAVSVTTDEGDTPTELVRLRKALGRDVPILVGGQQTAALNGSAAKLTSVPSLEAFRALLQTFARQN
jgi:MerR family transcriptional regulator, light-induced transcriptional regulator